MNLPNLPLGMTSHDLPEWHDGSEQERIDNQCGAKWCGEQRAEGYRLCGFHQMHSFREDLEYYKNNPKILAETLELMAELGER